MRNAFFLLLLVNLGFLAWAGWVDVPQAAPANDAYAKLPRLKLVSDQPPAAAPDTRRPAPAKARTTALETPVSASQGPQCVSVGPFEDQAGAAKGAALLRDKGLTPRQRTEQGEVLKGYWVFIGGLQTDHDVTQVLRTLEQSHVEDAHLMPDKPDHPDTHQVSVGLFSDRDRADHRAASVQKLGLQPEVAERKAPGTLFWMDVDLAPGTPPPTADAFPAKPLGPKVGIEPCPTGAPSPASAPQTTPFRTKVATGASASAPKVP